MYRLDIERENS